MRNARFRLVLRSGIGFLLALAVWVALAAPYTRLLASASQLALRLTERPAITSIVPYGPSATLMVVRRSDVPPSPATTELAVESTDITFNFILLVTLFAAASRPFSDRNVAGLAAAAVALSFVHVGAVMSFVNADYALNYGAWSAAHYGVVGRNVWAVAPYFYSVVGVHAAAFALWWLLRDPATPAETRRPANEQRAARSLRPRPRANGMPRPHARRRAAES